MANYNRDVDAYEKYLVRKERSKSTIYSYLWTVNDYYKRFGNLNKENLLIYKDYLIKKNKPKTVFSRIVAINGYLKFLDKPDLILLNVKLPKIMYLDHVISNKDYQYLKDKLKENGYMRDYFLVWMICTTGSRISEVLKFTVEDVKAGYMDIYGKGVKYRRLYVSSNLQEPFLVWLQEQGIESGPVFLSKLGSSISIRGVESNLRNYAKRFMLDPKDTHPHAFRHRFALNFIENYQTINSVSQVGAISDLADILGHSSINTTQIYLHRTIDEQRDMLTRIVNW